MPWNGWACPGPPGVVRPVQRFCSLIRACAMAQVSPCAFQNPSQQPFQGAPRRFLASHFSPLCPGGLPRPQAFAAALWEPLRNLCEAMPLPVSHLPCRQGRAWGMPPRLRIRPPGLDSKAGFIRPGLRARRKGLPRRAGWDAGLWRPSPGTGRAELIFGARAPFWRLARPLDFFGDKVCPTRYIRRDCKTILMEQGHEL